MQIVSKEKLVKTQKSWKKKKIGHTVLQQNVTAHIKTRNLSKIKNFYYLQKTIV